MISPRAEVAVGGSSPQSRRTIGRGCVSQVATNVRYLVATLKVRPKHHWIASAAKPNRNDCPLTWLSQPLAILRTLAQDPQQSMVRMVSANASPYECGRVIRSPLTAVASISTSSERRENSTTLRKWACGLRPGNRRTTETGMHARLKAPC